MKRHLLFLLSLVVICANFNLNAQLRPYVQPISIDEDDGNGAGTGGTQYRSPSGQYRSSGSSSSDMQLVDIYGNPICCESNEFNFILSFTAFSIVQSLNNELKKAREEAIKRWITSQETVLEKEIERQLGGSYSNYSTAQRGFFNEWVRNSRIAAFEQVKAPLIGKKNRLTEERRPIESEILNLNVWQKSACTSIQSGICDFVNNRRLRSGYLLRNVRQKHQYDSFYERAVNDFAKKHYEIGGVERKLKGIANYNSVSISNFNSLVEKHISYVNRQSAQRRILLMASYLIANNLRVYNQGQRIFTNFSLPNHLSQTTIINESKKREPSLASEFALFAPNIVQRGESACKLGYVYGPKGVVIRTTCSSLSTNQIAIRNRVLDSAMNEAGAIDPKNKNRLCGSYDWTVVGNSWTVNVQELGLTIIGRPRGRWEAINVDIPLSCITIPQRARNGTSISAESATTKVNLAWKSAVNRLGRDIRGSDPRSLNLRGLLAKYFGDAIKRSASRATFTQAPCRGNINTSVAKYCL